MADLGELVRTVERLWTNLLARVRVTAQLINATTGNHIWVERYDRALESVFAVQDEIADAVVNAIRPAIGHAEQQRVMRKPPNS